MCVYIKHRAQKPSFPEAKRYTERCGSRPHRLRRPHRVHTGPDSHTRTHAPRGLTAVSTAPSLLTALVREGSGLAGPFQTPSQETETTFLTGKEKPVRILPLTRPQHVLNWTSSSSEVPSGDISPPAVGGQWSLLEARSPGCWVRLPDGCGWCCGAWSLAPARDSPGRLVWEPGSLRRQTPPAGPRGKQRRGRRKRARAACPGAGSTSTYLDMEVSTDSEDG